MYSREQIDQVRNAHEIAEVIRTYVPSLKASGRTMKGLCPFHQEKTPSFHVQPEKGFFKCFGCGESGDVIAFISKVEHVPFADSLRTLAAQAGIVLKEDRQQEKPQEEGLKDKLYRLLAAAKVFYEDQLWNERLGKEARAYLEKRGVKEDTIQRFGLGLAPSTGLSCFEFLVKRGFTIELCQQAGLVNRSAAGRYYDPLYGRLIFPIFDNFGHVVGFGGRLLPQTKKNILELGEKSQDQEAPKYINSPESPVFSKGRLLYGLFQGKSSVLKARRLLVLEGYMDVIGAHQAGFDIGTATLGTALTGDHAKLIKRYAEEVVLYYDPDVAGQKAVLRGLEPLIKESLFPKVVIHSTQQDPDEYILENGKEAFSKILEQAPDFVDYILKTALTTDNPSVQEKAQVASQILGFINHSRNEVLKDGWMTKVARALGINKDSLNKESLKGRSKERDTHRPVPAKKAGGKPPLLSGEEELLQLLLNGAASFEGLPLKEEDFSQKRFKTVFSLMKQQFRAEGKFSAPALYDQLDAADKEWFMQLTMEGKEFSDPAERLEQLVRDLSRERDKKRLKFLSALMVSGTASPEVTEEYKNLLKKVKGTQSVKS